MVTHCLIINKVTNDIELFIIYYLSCFYQIQFLNKSFGWVRRNGNLSEFGRVW